MAIAGDALLHPIAVVAIGLLVVNDHWLKQISPGFVTGKLSDVAGLTFFPLFLLSGWELAVATVGRWHGATRRALGTTVLVTGVGFSFVKLTGVGAATFAWSLGAAQWVVALAYTAAAGLPTPVMAPVTVVRDASDLLALGGLGLALAIGLRRLPIGTLRSPLRSAGFA